MKTTEQIQNSAKSSKKKEILKIKVIQNISFPEIRRLVEMAFIKPTFAKIKKTPNENQINTQIKTKK